MADSGLVQREWVHELAPERARVRCRYKRQGKSIVEFTVQLEIQNQGRWRPAVRFDNAHGFCHRDDLHPDGSQEKTVLFAGDANETFTVAIEELQAHWESHANRFLREIKS
jgi:hypothetical protein